MTDFSSPLVIGLGEVLWDLFPDERRPGGAPANVAFQAQQLGARGIVASRVGQDADGDQLLAFLAENGLDTRCIQRDPIHPTGTVTVSLDSGGHGSYVIHENVAWDFIEFSPGAGPLGMLVPQADAVCFGSLAQRHAQSREAIMSAVTSTRPDCLRVYDVNLRQHYYSEGIVRDSLHAANVVKLNDDEVRVVADLLGLPNEERAFSQRVMREFDLQLVCVTRGARGCLLVSSGECHEEPGVKVQVVDTVGAGDAFTAGLITARLGGWTLAASAAFANRVGGLVASRRGAMPELRDEFAALRKELGP